MNSSTQQRSKRHAGLRSSIVLVLSVTALSIMAAHKPWGAHSEPFLGSGQAGSTATASQVEPQDLRDSYSAVLAFVDDRGLVRYADLKDRRSALDRFAAELDELAPGTYATWSESSRIAFWINAYNGLTLLAVVNHYPIRPTFFGSLRFPDNSIRQISGVWDELRFPVMDQHLTLDDIEHGILRKEFDEPRIHMALVCAAMGCPPLRNEPYRGEQLGPQLDDQTRRFLASPSKFRVDRQRGIVSLSPIFDWYGKDFIDKFEPTTGFVGRSRPMAAVLNFISGYVGPELQKYLRSSNYRVRFLDYDWSLNEQPRG